MPNPVEQGGIVDRTVGVVERYAPPVIVGVLAASCISMALTPPEGSRPSLEPDIYEPSDVECAPSQSMALPSAQESLNEVANMNFAMTPERLTILNERMQEADNIAEVQLIMNDVFDAYDMNVAIGELPEGADKFTHDTAMYDLRLAKISSRHILEVLQSVPESVMQDMSDENIYLTAGIELEGSPISAGYFTSEDGRRNMIIGIGKDDPTANNFRYELSVAIYNRVCQGVGFADGADAEFAKLNNPNFVYSDDWAKLRHAYDNSEVVSLSAAANQGQDELQTIQAVLRGGVRDCQFSPFSVACNKEDLFAQRLIERYPDFYYLIAFQSAYHAPRPQERAQSLQSYYSDTEY